MAAMQPGCAPPARGKLNVVFCDGHIESPTMKELFFTRTEASAAGEDGAEAGFGEDASDLVALIALDFDAAVFDCAAGAAGFLHLPGELLFFGQADAHEVRDDGDSLAAAPGGLADDIDAAAVFGGGGSVAS